MKKINFKCPRCGGHKLIGRKPLQWMQIDVLGYDDGGDLLLDHDRPSITYDDDDDDFEICCDKCYAQFSFESIKEMFNSGEQ
jgi:hypothetical protein